MDMIETAELLTIEPAALQGLEVVDLVADWNVGEQIDITLLLEQFADAHGAQHDASLQGESVVADVSSPPTEASGDVIVLDLTTHGGLAALYDDLAPPSPAI